MTTKLDALLRKLEREGEANDERVSDRALRMLNITRDTGEFLAVVIKAACARDILEIGTSNGYSTLFLADAVTANKGVVTTVERSAFKRDLALVNFAQTDLTSRINSVLADAGNYLIAQPDANFDFIFLDSERTEYAGWWHHLKRILRPGGLLVMDNSISHPSEVASVIALITADTDFTCCLVPVGKGEFIAHRAA